MKILIIGCGKVGYTLAKHLSEEDNDVTLIDKDADRLDETVVDIDVMCVKGNGLSVSVLLEAGADTAGLVICVTSGDETNILCCLTAKKLGAKHAVARIRDPEYALELAQFRNDLGIDMIINPEQLAAMEIFRLLRFPTANEINTFFGGEVELVSFRVTKGDFFADKSIKEISAKIKLPILFGLIERGDGVIIPFGDLILRTDDIVKVLGKPSDVYNFFKDAKKQAHKVRDILIIGGGKITIYLVNLLEKLNYLVKVIEINKEKCLELNENTQNCTIIRADGTDEDLLRKENIQNSDSVVCLTNTDEENAIVGLHAKQLGVQKVIVKINKVNHNIIKNLGLESVVSPHSLTANIITGYVRSLKKTRGSNIRTFYKLTSDDLAEAMELTVNSKCKCIDKPLKDVKFKEGVLVGCIIHKGKIIIPNGSSTISDGDSVIIISSIKNISNIDDALAR